MSTRERGVDVSNIERGVCWEHHGGGVAVSNPERVLCWEHHRGFFAGSIHERDVCREHPFEGCLVYGY